MWVRVTSSSAMQCQLRPDSKGFVSCGGGGGCLTGDGAAVRGSRTPGDQGHTDPGSGGPDTVSVPGRRTASPTHWSSDKGLQVLSLGLQLGGQTARCLPFKEPGQRGCWASTSAPEHLASPGPAVIGARHAMASH